MAIVAIVFGGAAVIWYVVQRRKSDALRASVDMMVEWHRQSVAQQQARIDKLKQNFEQNREKIKKMRSKLAAQKTKLREKYVDKGLTADEIATRFNRISL